MRHGPHRRRTPAARHSAPAAVLIAMAVLALALVLPPAPAHAAGASPVGSFDSAAVAGDGSIALNGWTADPIRPRPRCGST